MKNAAIIYNSKTGITKKYAEEIESDLKLKGLEVKILPIEEYTNEVLNDVDYLFLGCWTSGLMFFYQHPEKKWKDFAEKLPNPLKPKIAFFTTYKILTGSMFKKMHEQINVGMDSSITEFKSRNGKLSDSDKAVLVNFIN